MGYPQGEERYTAMPGGTNRQRVHADMTCSMTRGLTCLPCVNQMTMGRHDAWRGKARPDAALIDGRMRLFGKETGWALSGKRI